MKLLIGNYIEICFKASEDRKVDNAVKGILVLVDDDNIYLQSPSQYNIFIVPRSNVLYYSTNELPKTEKVIDNYTTTSLPPTNRLEVIVNGNECKDCVEIDLPPTIKLDKWSDNIYKIVINNLDVKNLLMNKTQKRVDFFAATTNTPAKIVVDVEEIEHTKNEFSMPADDTQSNFATQYLNPSQLATLIKGNK